MVEGGRLESVWVAIPLEFESLRLRQIIDLLYLNISKKIHKPGHDPGFAILPLFMTIHLYVPKCAYVRYTMEQITVHILKGDGLMYRWGVNSMKVRL